MRNALWIPRATDTLSEYVVLIDFPLQKWLHQCPSMLRYAYFAFLVKDLAFVFISDILNVILADSTSLSYNKLQLEFTLL
jgi:hypothetical protein